MNRSSNLLLEYGERVKGDSTSEAFNQEHMEALIPSQALQKLQKV